jgi:hypothetical protein
MARCNVGKFLFWRYLIEKTCFEIGICGYNASQLAAWAGQRVQGNTGAHRLAKQLFGTFRDISYFCEGRGGALCAANGSGGLLQQLIDSEDCVYG